jgi:hypothetical protein
MVPPSADLPPPSDPSVLVELAGVLDEQAAPAIASAATVVRKKCLDVMRSSALEIGMVARVCWTILRTFRTEVVVICSGASA